FSGGFSGGFGAGGFGSGYSSGHSGTSRGFGAGRGTSSRSGAGSSAPAAGCPNRIRPNREGRSVQGGERASRRAFGLRTGTEVTGVADKTVAVSDFGSAGSKRLLLRYAPIDKLN